MCVVSVTGHYTRNSMYGLKYGIEHWTSRSEMESGLVQLGGTPPKKMANNRLFADYSDQKMLSSTTTLSKAGR